MILEVAKCVFVNVRVVEKNFVAFHARKRIANLAFARAQSFHFRAAQNDSRLEGFEDVIIAPGFRIGDNVRHKQQQPEGRPSGRLL
jgi:hypothetical protein